MPVVHDRKFYNSAYRFPNLDILGELHFLSGSFLQHDDLIDCLADDLMAIQLPEDTDSILQFSDSAFHAYSPKNNAI